MYIYSCNSLQWNSGKLGAALLTTNNAELAPDSSKMQVVGKSTIQSHCLGIYSVQICGQASSSHNQSSLGSIIVNWGMAMLSTNMCHKLHFSENRIFLKNINITHSFSMLFLGFVKDWKNADLHS